MEERKITPDELWSNYTTHNCRKWLGNWTKWNPITGDILESFDTIRHIQLIDDSRMKHQNTFINNDGSFIDSGPMNGPWEYIKHRDCDSQGIMHPSSRKLGIEARAFFVQNGGGVWTVTNIKANKMFFMEMFFPDHNKRFSTGLHYGRDGKILRTSMIREDTRARPGPYWSQDTSLKDHFGTSQGEYHGTEIKLFANLTQHTKTACRWEGVQSLGQEYKTIVLPDNIMMSFPVTIDPGRSFQVHTCCCYREGQHEEIREGRVFFTEGAFSYFKQGVYTCKT